MKSNGFEEANTYRIRGNLESCLTAGAQFSNGSDRYKIILAPQQDAEQQRFFLDPISKSPEEDNEAGEFGEAKEFFG